MALVFAPVSFARIFLIPLMGPIGDSCSRKTIVIISDLWRGAMFIVLAAMAKFDIFNLPLVVLLLMLTTAGTALFTSISGSIVTQLVKKEDLSAAIERSTFIVSVGSLAGGLVGGIALNYVGVMGAFVINAVSFLVAAAASFYMRPMVLPAPHSGRAGGALKAWTQQLKAGFSVVFNIPLQLWLCVLLAFINLAASPLNMALPALVKDSHNLSPGFIGVLNSAMGAGTILGSLIVGWMCSRMHSDIVVSLGIGLIGASMAALFVVPGTYLVIAVMLALGLATMLVNVPLSVKLMAATPDNFRSRVGSVSSFMSQAAVPIGTALTGVMIAACGMKLMMIVAGAAIVLSAPLLFYIPRFSAFFRMPEPDTHDFFLKNYPEVFSRHQ